MNIEISGKLLINFFSRESIMQNEVDNENGGEKGEEECSKGVDDLAVVF